MANTGQSRGPRSAENRRKLIVGQASWHGRVRKFLRAPLFVAFGFWALATLIMVTGDEPLPYSVGKVLKQPVLTRVNFERVDELATQKARSDAQHAVPNYFRFNQQLLESVKTEFRDLVSAVSAAETLEKFAEQNPGKWTLDTETFSAIKAKAQIAGTTDPFRTNLEKLSKAIQSQYLIRDLIEKAAADRDLRSTADHVVAIDAAGQSRQIPLTRLLYAVNDDQRDGIADYVASQAFASDSRMRSAFRSIMIRAIGEGPARQPTYVFDLAMTKERLEAAANIEPVKVKYAKGDRILPPGKVTEESLALLKLEHEEYLRQRGRDPELLVTWRNRRLGLAGVLLLVTVGMSLFTMRVQPRIAGRAPRAIGVCGLILAMLLIERDLVMQLSDSPIWCVLPVCMTAAIFAIAYSQIYAMGAAGALALITSLMLGAPYGLMIVFFSVIVTTVLKLNEIRTRMKMLEVAGAASLAAYLSTFLVYLGDGEANFLGDPLYAAIATMAGLSMVHVLLPIIERVYRVTTSQTLLEWADTSRPLLRQLIEKAPGTWQHSHLLGSMAEAAAEEIGANGLLVRVGAYYHDIGKMCKPNYFVENQEARMNAHRGLAPTMSLLVILAHVKDGLALAREHGLPPVLHQFIAEHHGTTVVKYFHHMAAQEAKAAGHRGREVSETEFRYAGPKPRSKETAILMLCDGVEGAVRSLQDPTPGRIETVVHDITMARLMDGQFDECEITLNELAKLEQSLVRSLRAIHHGRIAYPKSQTGGSTQAKTA